MSIYLGMTGNSNISTREITVEAPVWTFRIEDCLDRFPDGHVELDIHHEVGRLFADYGYEVTLYSPNHRSWDDVEKNARDFTAWVEDPDKGTSIEIQQGQSFVFPVTAPFSVTR